MTLLTLHSQSLSSFTGFGDDPNWSVKFGIRRKGSTLPDWDSKARRAQLVPATGNDIITQVRGRDPWVGSFRIWSPCAEDLDRLDAMINTRATLRYVAGRSRRAGGSVQTIEDRQYLVYPGTMLMDLTEVDQEPNGQWEATAAFMRPYTAPPVFVPPVWPPAPYPGVRVLPDPLLFLTQPYSRNAAGAIAPASGAARPVTMSSYGAWRIIPGAKNAIRNPLFSGTGNWQADEAGTTITANGDGSARIQASAIYGGISQAPGTGLAAVQGETVTLSVWMRSRTTTKTINMQCYAHSANNYSGNTTDQSNNNKTVTTSWQQFTVTKTLADAATQFIFIRLSLPASVATDIDIREPIVTKASSAPEFVPAVVGGVLLVGDTWDATPDASSSTRAAGSLSASLASFGNLYLRYSTDGSTVVNTVLTGPGAVGGVGTVAYSGGVLTITSTGPLWIGAAITYPGTISPSQKTYLDSVATSALTWTM